MSIIRNPGGLARLLSHVPTDQHPGQECDLCLEEWGTGPLLYWCLGPKWLWLHPECASSLGNKLITDATTPKDRT